MLSNDKVLRTCRPAYTCLYEQLFDLAKLEQACDQRITSPVEVLCDVPVLALFGFVFYENIYYIITGTVRMRCMF